MKPTHLPWRGRKPNPRQNGVLKRANHCRRALPPSAVWLPYEQHTTSTDGPEDEYIVVIQGIERTAVTTSPSKPGNGVIPDLQ